MLQLAWGLNWAAYSQPETALLFSPNRSMAAMLGYGREKWGLDLTIYFFQGCSEEIVKS
jgi:hypothetical protein